MCSQSLLLNAPYLPSFLEAALPNSLAHILLKRKSLQGSVKATVDRCNTELSWLRLLSPLQPPKNSSLQADNAYVQRLQAVSAFPGTQSAKKRQSGAKPAVSWAGWKPWALEMPQQQGEGTMLQR